MNQPIYNIIEDMSPETLVILRQKIGGDTENWKVSEIGDGNVNFIFKLQGSQGQVLIKQAVPYLRCVGESWPLSLKRNYFEFKALEIHSRYASDYLPKVFSFNEKSASMVMEFLGEHQILRKGMMAGIQYPHFCEHITDYMARTLFFTSDLALSAASKKEQMKLFCENVDLCKITEDLIFTDPYRPSPQNHWTSPQLDRLVQEFQADVELKIAATEMKAKFLSEAQALIHGDLHSGSIMVSEKETKVIDPEFSFYGPMGFDVGLLLANFLMSYFSQSGYGEKERAQYELWILVQVEQIWLQFSQKFSLLWDECLNGDYLKPQFSQGTERTKIVKGLRSKYMTQLFTDSIRFAGCEMIRRIVGLAQVADLEMIEDVDQRALCQKRSMNMAREMMVNFKNYQNIEHITQLANKMRALA